MPDSATISDETIEAIRDHYAEAMRKRIKGSGPYNLAWLLYSLGNKVEAAAWLSIDKRVGGDGFERRR